VIRFGLYGCFITAPSLYCWVRVATFMWVQFNNKLKLFNKINLKVPKHKPPDCDGKSKVGASLRFSKNCELFLLTL
jgi:hypothetical protein